MKILLPVDGSANSMRAIEHTLNIAKKHSEAKVTLLTVACMHVFRTYDYNLVNLENLHEKCISSWRPVLEEAQKMFVDAGLQVESVIVNGDPADVISQYAEENQMDRLIMGSRGLGGFKGLILGSVAYKVLSKVNIPVTIIK
ncbi:MAG: universal stress protein [Firmicutes bacterium]|nr:universal stress protein [Bacillota bacterium]